ncbi:MAG: hypothetical protein ACT4O6_25345 [Reyranella sp.]
MKQNDWKIAASLAATIVLGGCGWFDGSGGIPAHMKDARPGADRAAPVVKALPPPEGNHPHEAGVVPADETGRGAAAIGATLQGKGGQKAQRDEAEKQASELSRKAREQRAEREAASEKTAAPEETAPAPEPPAAPKD